MNTKTFFIAFISIISLPSKILASPSVHDKIKGSIFGGLIGDALGRPTEFISTTRAIFAKFPNGICSWQDLKKHTLLEKGIAPYTDDTGMARVTLDTLIKARQEKWNLNKTTYELAIAYRDDMARPNDLHKHPEWQEKDKHNPQGWSKPARAPGNACLKNMTTLKEVTKNKESYDPREQNKWWLIDAHRKLQPDERKEGGCGSVMRAHPFGLVWADDPQKAAQWAAEHSRITHDAPIAVAACAAMAVGTAYAVQGKDPEFIANEMAKIAGCYDRETRTMIEEAIKLAQENKKYAHDQQKLFEVSKPIFEKWLGWAAHDAIAAATYIFLVASDDIKLAWYLGVHTPGDSDSLASMAGALVGARIGFETIKKAEPHYAQYEDAQALEKLAAQVPSQQIAIAYPKPPKMQINKISHKHNASANSTFLGIPTNYFWWSLAALITGTALYKWWLS